MNSVEVVVGHTEMYPPQTLWYHQNHPNLRFYGYWLLFKTLCMCIGHNMCVHNINYNTYNEHFLSVFRFQTCEFLCFRNTNWSTEDYHWKSQTNCQQKLSLFLFSHPLDNALHYFFNLWYELINRNLSKSVLLLVLAEIWQRPFASAVCLVLHQHGYRYPLSHAHFDQILYERVNCSIVQQRNVS